MTWGKYYWPYFMILTVLLFGVPELIAIISGNVANTLSDYSWDQLDVHGFTHVHDIAWFASLGVWLLFVVVITAHIWWRSW